MTKELILYSQDTDFIAGRCMVPDTAAYAAMDTYARQEAIGFNWWLTLGDWKPRTTNEWCRYESGDIKIYSTEGLYNKYEEWKVQYNQEQKQK